MNSQENSRSTETFEASNVHPAPEASKPGEHDPKSFRSLLDDNHLDATLIRLGRQLEWSFQKEQELVKAQGSEDDCSRQIKVSSEIADRISETQATTAPGLAVKLRAWMWAKNDLAPDDVLAESDTSESRYMASVCADALALQSGTSFVPPASLDAPIDAAWKEHQRLASDLNHLHETAGAAASGLTAMGVAVQAEERLSDLSDQILHFPALSLRGIGIKASWALTHTTQGERNLKGVLQQVEAFARRHNYTRMPNIPALQRDVVGGLPAADWHLYDLFNKWFESANEMRALDEEHERAFDQHGDESEEYKAASAAAEQQVVRTWAFRDALLRMPAASVQGVQLKSIVYAWLCRDDAGMQEREATGRKQTAAGDSAFAFQVVRELARLGAPDCLKTNAAPQSQPDRRALESYRTWLSNEYRSLTAEMYPNMPDTLGAISVNNAGDRFHFRGEPPASTRAERILDMFVLDWRSDDSPFADRLGERAA